MHWQKSPCVAPCVKMLELKNRWKWNLENEIECKHCVVAKHGQQVAKLHPTCSENLLLISTVLMKKWKNKKMVKSGRGLGHVTYFSNFGTPLISPERLKIQTSNFACRLTLRDNKPKKWKTGQKRAWPRSYAKSSRFRDLLNEQATEALRNGKIRLPTLLLNVDLVCWLFGRKKAKINFKKLTISLTLQCKGLVFSHT